MIENSKALIPALFHGDEGEVNNALARYKTARAVRIVADRVGKTDKSEAGRTESECLLIAQAALATGLSPFEPQPELWHWVRVANDGRRFLTLMRGRDGTSRIAEENARRAGTYLYDPVYTLITDKKQLAALGFQENDLVVQARVSNHAEVMEYYGRRKLLADEGLTTDEIDQRVGDKEPASVGYGYISADEMKKLDTKYGKPDRNKMPHINRCEKRALVEAYKRKWAPQISIAALSAGEPENIDAYAIDTEWRELPPGDEPASPDAEKKKRPKRISADKVTIVTDPPKQAGLWNNDDRPYPPAKVKEIYTKRLAVHKGKRKVKTLTQNCAMLLNACFTGSAEEVKTNRQRVQLYLAGKPSLTDFTGPELLALLDLLQAQKNKHDKWHPNALSLKEMRAIATAVEKED